MDARIIIKGNQSLGYKVALELPTEWLKKFGPSSAIEVAGRDLRGEWGSPSQTSTVREADFWVRTETEARQLKEKIRGEIKAAKEYLESLVDLHHECVISID